jgi:hypothetical protein
MKNIETYILEATQAIELGSFPSKSAQKNILDGLNYSYQILQRTKSYASLEEAGYSFWDIPNDLHNVREKHQKIFEAGKMDWETAKMLIDLRTQVKAMEVVKPTPKPKAQPTGNQATHQGTCQICGRIHKVDNHSGRVAKHGYTKQFGFFNGTCHGSDKLPLEVSNDALKQDVVNTEKRILETDPEGFITVIGYNGKERKISNKQIIQSLEHHLKVQKQRLSEWTPKELIKVGA